MKLPEGTGGEIGTAESAVEKRVPGEEGVRDPVVEAYPSGGVSGSGDHLENMIAEIEYVRREQGLAGHGGEIHSEQVGDRDGTVP